MSANPYSDSSTYSTCYFGREYGDPKVQNVHVSTHAKLNDEGRYGHPPESERILWVIQFLKKRYAEQVVREAERKAKEVLRSV